MSEDQAGALVSGVLLAAATLGVWWVVAAGADGRLGVNHWMGMRTSATMSSQDAWQAGHRAALPIVKPSCLAAAVVAGAGAVLGFRPPLGVVLMLVAAGLMLVGTIAGGVAAHRAARSVSQQPTEG